MQIDVGGGNGAHSLATTHFREMWTRSFLGFLRTARNGETIDFVPELLSSENSYARGHYDTHGMLIEQGDRWEQALVMAELAKASFLEAIRHHKLGTPEGRLD